MALKEKLAPLLLPQNTLSGLPEPVFPKLQLVKTPDKLFLFAASCIIFWLMLFRGSGRLGSRQRG